MIRDRCGPPRVTRDRFRGRRQADTLIDWAPQAARNQANHIPKPACCHAASRSNDERDIVNASSTFPGKRLAHRLGIAAAVLWWGYAFLSTSFFSGMSALGLAVYLLGLPVCYLLVFFAVRGIAWALLNLLP